MCNYKRISALLLAVIMLLSLCACGKNEAPSAGNSGAEQEAVHGTADASTPASGNEETLAPGSKEDNAPNTNAKDPEEPLGITFEIIGTTLYVRGRGPMEDYSGSPFRYDGITEVVVEEGVTSIGNYAFEKINSLAKVTLPETLEKIGNSAFTLTPLQEIDLPSGLISIGSSAFSHCENLTSITGGENLEYVDVSAFYKVPYVENHPEDALIIGHCYVKYNGSDSEVVVPEGVTLIASEAFKSCWTVASVSLPEGLLEIGNSAFYDCKGLSSVHIPDTVHTLGGSAFAKCPELRTVTGGNGLLHVGGDIFTGSPWKGQPQGDFMLLGSALIDYRGESREIMVPEGIKGIAYGVFQMEDNATSIYLPDGLVAIGFQAFHQCKAESISIPSSIEYIDNHVFLGSRIKTVTFRGTEDQWKILDKNGEPYVFSSIAVEYTG